MQKRSGIKSDTSKNLNEQSIVPLPVFETKSINQTPKSDIISSTTISTNTPKIESIPKPIFGLSSSSSTVKTDSKQTSLGFVSTPKASFDFMTPAQKPAVTPKIEPKFGGFSTQTQTPIINKQVGSPLNASNANVSSSTTGFGTNANSNIFLGLTSDKPKPETEIKTGDSISSAQATPTIASVQSGFAFSSPQKSINKNTIEPVVIPTVISVKPIVSPPTNVSPLNTVSPQKTQSIQLKETTNMLPVFEKPISNLSVTPVTKEENSALNLTYTTSTSSINTFTFSLGNTSNVTTAPNTSISASKPSFTSLTTPNAVSTSTSFPSQSQASLFTSNATSAATR